MKELRTATAGEQADALASNVLGFFGSAKPAEGDQEALGRAIIHFAMHWVEDKYELGIPCGNTTTCSVISFSFARR